MTALRTRPPAPSASPTRHSFGLTIYGCGHDEAALFRELAPRAGIRLTITEAAISEATVDLAVGSRCVSVDHKTPITRPLLLALSEAGVAYVSTRSIGLDHVDVSYAASVGISVGNVAYAPDGVADYTVMLMLMVLRHARSTIRRVDAHDYRLNDARGRELRDLTVGVIGTGRIGAAVIDRLLGFGCRVVASDHHRKTPAEYVPLDVLLGESDIVTLHLPLNPETHHLLDRDRIERLKAGASVVNTGRGALIDTEALVSALERGRLAGAALDVVEGEENLFYADWRDRPIRNQLLLRLQALPNVVISPHTAYFTDHALRETVEQTVVGCRSFVNGRRSWLG